MEFVDMPLTDVIDYLKDFHKIEIQLDKKAMDEAGIGTDTTVTKNLKDIPLRSALRLILHELGLTYVVENEVLLITTNEAAEARCEPVVYPVADLVEKYRDRNGNITPDFDSLIEMIQSTVAPSSWDEVGGPGSIAKFDTNLSLVLDQTQEVHEEVVDLLEQLRTAKQSAGPPPQSATDLPLRKRPYTLSGLSMNGGTLGGIFRRRHGRQCCRRPDPSGY